MEMIQDTLKCVRSTVPGTFPVPGQSFDSGVALSSLGQTQASPNDAKASFSSSIS